MQRISRAGRPLLEREIELLAVDDALSDLTGPRHDGAGLPGRPRGGLLGFAGPAGLGKTSLLAEVRRRAAALGCTVLSARGGEQEQRVAFHVARQLLQPQLAGSGDAALRASLGTWYSIVGPALGLCTAEGGAPPDPQGLSDGLDWVLRHIALRRGPVVLVLDDAHWADPESLRWLASFAPRADNLPMLIVVAYRPGELPAHAESLRGLPGRAGHRPVGLEPLSADAVGRLARGILGERADDAFCGECWAVTAGNPFEAVELIAKVRDRGLRPDAASAHLLRDLAAAVKGRGLTAVLERLGPSTVRFAWAAAVLGASISPALAASVAGLGKEEAADAADRLRQARILAVGERLEFVHPLIATGVYRAIPDAVRVALHGQAAWSVINAGHGPAAAARHFLETHTEGDPWVVKQLRAAAAQTLRAGAPDAARSYLARALSEPPPPAEFSRWRGGRPMIGRAGHGAARGRRTPSATYHVGMSFLRRRSAAVPTGPDFDVLAMDPGDWPGNLGAGLLPGPDGSCQGIFLRYDLFGGRGPAMLIGNLPEGSPARELEEGQPPFEVAQLLVALDNNEPVQVVGIEDTPVMQGDNLLIVRGVKLSEARIACSQFDRSDGVQVTIATWDRPITDDLYQLLKPLPAEMFQQG